MKNRLGGVLACLLMVACDGGNSAVDASGIDAATDAGPGGPCARESDCEDGLFCTVHRCRPGETGADARGCLLQADMPCAVTQTCDEAGRACVAVDCSDPDRDLDGADSHLCAGQDCDDDDSNRYPGNREVCDAEGHDEDCLADTFAGPEGDLDGDGEVSAMCCNGDACGSDCDDTNPLVNSAAREVCNGIDDDCSGAADDTTGTTSLCPGGVCTAGRCSFSPWDRIFGGSGNDSAHAIATDDEGNVYVAGVFGPGVDFGSGPEPDAGLVSYTADGVMRWVLRHGGAGILQAWGLAFDEDRDALYLLGRTGGPATFGSITVDGAFLLRLDTDGSARWVVPLPPLLGGTDRRAAVAARGGVVAVVSSFDRSFDFGDGTERAPVGSKDGYAAVYDASGALSWVNLYGGAGASTSLRAVSIDSTGSVYLAGDFNGTVDFGGGAQAAMGDASVVVSVDASGGHRWSRTYDSVGSDNVEALAAGEERLFLAGTIGGPIDFGGGPVGASGSQAGYVLALSLDGSYAWERVLSGSGYASPQALVARDDDRISVVGRFAGSVNFGGGGSLTSTPEVVGGVEMPTEDIFMVTYRGDRVHIRDRALGAEGGQVARAVAVGPGGAATIAGSFQGRVNFGTGVRASDGGQWGFVARIVD